MCDADHQDVYKRQLYGVYQEMKEDVKLTAIPYFLWNNRGEGEMKVWIPVE